MTTLAIIAVVAGVLIVIPAFWCAVVLALSFASGWQGLAASYEAKEAARGRRFSGQSGSVGGVSYRNILDVHVAPDGLFLALPFLFKVGHKPLFIPWSAIHDQKPVKFLWHEAVSIQVGTPPVVRIRLPREVFDARNAR